MGQQLKYRGSKLLEIQYIFRLIFTIRGRKKNHKSNFAGATRHIEDFLRQKTFFYYNEPNIDATIM
jgi:hypothetical protein